MATDAVQYTVLGLIAARSQGAHGYQLKVEFDSLYADFWSLNYGQLYRTLDRLERAGLIRGNEEVQSGRPNRAAGETSTTGCCFRRAMNLGPCARTCRPPPASRTAQGSAWEGICAPPLCAR